MLPYQHVEKIAPQKAEPEEKLAHVVKVVGGEAALLSFPQIEQEGQDDQAAQPHVERLDERIGAEQRGVPVRVHAHDQVISDQRKHQGKGQDVKPPDRFHPRTDGLRIARPLTPFLE